MSVTVQGDEFAKLPSLRTAQECAAEIRVLTAERLTELATSGYAPCWFVDGVPWFQVTAVRAWCATQFGKKQPGRPFPRATSVAILDGPVPFDVVPDVLKPIANLLRPSRAAASLSGVYFLVDGADREVVYVGQAVQVDSRISSHLREGTKMFSDAMWLPVPESELNEVESSFIRLLRPKLNGNQGRMVAEPHSTLARHLPQFIGSELVQRKSS